ncbi:DUF4347 domain-containing protein [Leptothermofonsia sichuanensis E412]|uniref:DUF4347 domain-containing protein n=1 Tax=Leptothermofonsia sichuanensis TaxID=2917832 RepID=UPI001CA6EDEC|nr:DUF4347 domain-containing protein [Leptothermofonsia sichuanensis]QZZ19176.1 DUF4347 domain-containing protein [Leptothermofonsia sichuanensis E412]
MLNTQRSTSFLLYLEGKIYTPAKYISSIHIVSHGEAGGIRLGSDWLNLNSLQTYASQLQSWGTALTEDADILLYGCNVAEGELGQAFVQIMSQLTGADIAASSNLTGSAALGGDWVLEVNTGNIEALLPFASSVLVNYGSILPVGPDGFGYIAASTQLQLIDLVPGAPDVFNTGLVGDDPPVFQLIWEAIPSASMGRATPETINCLSVPMD